QHPCTRDHNDVSVTTTMPQFALPGTRFPELFLNRFQGFRELRLEKFVRNPAQCLFGREPIEPLRTQRPEHDVAFQIAYKHLSRVEQLRVLPQRLLCLPALSNVPQNN